MHRYRPSLVQKSSLLILILLFLGGCVTGTRNVPLSAPEYQGSTNVNGTITLGKIIDNRQFEAKPKSPSTPSVKGDPSAESREDLATYIGRQRNGYGAAMGVVRLPEGGTVQDEMRKVLVSGLEGRGYRVAEGAAESMKIDVDIEKFWAWMTPTFFTVNFRSEVVANLTLTGQGKNSTMTIVGNGLNVAQQASNANWALAYTRAFTDFLEKLDVALSEKGL